MEKAWFHQSVVYHDETKDVPGRNFKGHVLLIVPLRSVQSSDTPLFGPTLTEYFPQQLLFEKIMELRNKHSCDGKLHFTKVKGKTWSKYDGAYLELLSVTVDALRSKQQKQFPHPLNCKVAVMFYPKGADWSLYGGPSRKEQKLRHDETILRMLLKGAAHYLYDENNCLEISNIICDGESGYRHFNDERIIWHLKVDELYGKVPLRDYVTFAENSTITHLPSDHNQYGPNTEEFIHANLLQVADLLLGAIMRACYSDTPAKGYLPKVGEQCQKKDVIAQPLKKMLDKKVRRGAGFARSGHHRSFTINQVTFSAEGPIFKEVLPRQSPSDENSLQMEFTE